MVGLAGRRVLVVDDDVMVRYIVADEFESAGCAVIEAEDGTEALDILAGGADVDLLVTDIRMPRLDGWTLAERARALRPDLSVLYVTGWSDIAARPVRGSEIVAKPFRPTELVASAARVMQA